jgi:peptidoglycan L-alanyl-D-glutamate endopeptidase CwlK
MDTIDRYSQERIALVYPDVRVRWIQLANSFFELHKMMLGVAQGLRTYADQAAIYAQGRTTPGPDVTPERPMGRVVTHSAPGDSWHHFSAIDSKFMGADPWLDGMKDRKQVEFLWSEYARLAKAHGFVAGFDWPDPKKDRPHIEMTYGLNLAQAKALYAHGGLKAVWAKFDQIRGVEVGSEYRLS